MELENKCGQRSAAMLNNLPCCHVKQYTKKKMKTDQKSDNHHVTKKLFSNENSNILN